MKGTELEFAAWVIGEYKESGNHLVEIKDVPQDIQGSIEVLEFVAAHLNVLDLNFCKNVAGQSGTVPAFPSFLWRTSPLFLWKIPFFGVTDSALPTFFSTSLPRGLMPVSPFVLATAIPQATSRRSRSARS